MADRATVLDGCRPRVGVGCGCVCFAQQPRQAGLATWIYPFFCQYWHDARRWQMGKSWFIGYLKQPLTLFGRQGMGWPGADSLRALVAGDQPVAGLPTLQGTDIDTSLLASQLQPCACLVSISDVPSQNLMIFETEYAAFLVISPLHGGSYRGDNHSDTGGIRCQCQGGHRRLMSFEPTGTDVRSKS